MGDDNSRIIVDGEGDFIIDSDGANLGHRYVGQTAGHEFLYAPPGMTDAEAWRLLANHLDNVQGEA